MQKYLIDKKVFYGYKNNLRLQKYPTDKKLPQKHSMRQLVYRYNCIFWV